MTLAVLSSTGQVLYRIFLKCDIWYISRLEWGYRFGKETPQKRRSFLSYHIREYLTSVCHHWWYWFDHSSACQFSPLQSYYFFPFLYSIHWKWVTKSNPLSKVRMYLCVTGKICLFSSTYWFIDLIIFCIIWICIFLYHMFGYNSIFHYFFVQIVLDLVTGSSFLLPSMPFWHDRLLVFLATSFLVFSNIVLSKMKKKKSNNSWKMFRFF